MWATPLAALLASELLCAVESVTLWPVVFKANSGEMVISSTVVTGLSISGKYLPWVLCLSVLAPITCSRFPSEFHLTMSVACSMYGFVDSF